MHWGIRATLPLVFFLVVIVSPVTAQKTADHSNLEAIGKRELSKRSWNFWSLEEELRLGERLAADVARSSRLLDDPEVTRYVQELAERIVRNSDSRVPLVVSVVDSDEVNAFALPGGYFFVTTGLLLEATSEAELASVIAHEVAHVAARHATRQMTKGRIWDLVSLPLLFLSGPAGYAIHQTAALAVPLTFLKFSRDAEREADYLGLQYHYVTGYDPAAFVSFFERTKGMEKEKKGSIAKAFSTHPMTRDRILAAGQMIEQELPERGEYVVNTSQFDAVRARLEAARSRRDSEEGPVLRLRSQRLEFRPQP